MENVTAAQVKDALERVIVLNVKANAFSEGAKAKIEALGGTCEVI